VARPLIISVGHSSLPKTSEFIRIAENRKKKPPRRAGSEFRGGTKTAADSSSEGSVKNDEHTFRIAMKWITSGLPTIDFL
jgi:hypothetical protein